jgi:hypothetical protein
MAAFEDAVLTHGAELRTVRDEVGARTIYEVVRYYGHWKKYISSLWSYLTLNHPKQYETRGRVSEAASTWRVENTATVRTQHALR